MADRRQGETRYRLAESTRYFAQDKLAAAGEENRRVLHAQHFAARFAGAAQAWETSASEPWVARFGGRRRHCAPRRLGVSARWQPRDPRSSWSARAT